MEIQTSGIMDEGWTFPGMKAEATQQRLCMHTEHIAVFLCGQKQKAPYCTSVHEAKHFLLSKKIFVKNFCILSLAVF